MFKKIACFLFVLLFAHLPSYAANTVHLTSVTWKPYTGEKLVHNGFSTAVAKAAFATQGYDFKVSFFPWKRAVLNAKENDNFDGYFPEYFSSDVEEDFIYSDTFGKSPIGFIKRKETKINWSNLEDLAPHKIGTVQGYINTTEFDQLVIEGILKTEAATSDIVNIRKVAEGRVPMAIIDKNVFQYLMLSDEQLHKYSNDLEFFHELESKDLYICFKRTPEGETLKNVFNAGLKEINADEIEQACLAAEILNSIEDQETYSTFTGATHPKLIRTIE